MNDSAQYNAGFQFFTQPCPTPLLNSLQVFQRQQVSTLRQCLSDELAQLAEFQAARGLEEALDQVLADKGCTVVTMEVVLAALQHKVSEKVPALMSKLSSVARASFDAAADLMLREPDEKTAGGEFTDFSRFCDVWDELLKNYKDLHLGPSLQGSRRLLARYVKARDTMVALAEMDFGAKGYEQTLDISWDRTAKLMQAVGQKFEIKEPPPWARSMLDACKKLHHMIQTPLVETSASYLNKVADEIEQAEQLLSDIAGGAQNGADWHAGKAPHQAVLDHFMSTLDKVDLSQMHKLCNSLEQKRLALVAAIGKYIPAGTQPSDEIADALQRSSRSITRAHLTKFELKACRTLKKSSHKKDRLQGYITDFSSATKDFAGQSWEDLMEPSLVLEVKRWL